MRSIKAHENTTPFKIKPVAMLKDVKYSYENIRMLEIFPVFAVAGAWLETSLRSGESSENYSKGGCVVGNI